eukprot:1140118-Pelagomonas_calceolata.AAC.5
MGVCQGEQSMFHEAEHARARKHVSRSGASLARSGCLIHQSVSGWAEHVSRSGARQGTQWVLDSSECIRVSRACFTKQSTSGHVADA